MLLHCFVCQGDFHRYLPKTQYDDHLQQCGRTPTRTLRKRNGETSERLKP